MDLIQDYNETASERVSTSPSVATVGNEISLIPQESNPIPLSEAERNLQVVEMMLEENIVNSNDKSMYASDVPTPFGKCQSLYEVAVYLNKHLQSYQEGNHLVEFELVVNDGTNESNIKLIALKNIFSKQLPKMPKEYIVRLVFDKRHISLAIKKNSRIIGGICYRPYQEQKFGEIAFCAISSQEQVRGFGTRLMNQLKFVAQRTDVEYFLTYADNYAIGYFQKQGFSKHISMPKERWVGFIKDYDGGTLMECYVHPAIDYLDVKGIVEKQRRFILERIQENSRSNIVYPGLEVFREGRRLQNVLDLPGVQEARWTSLSVYRSTTERDRTVMQSRLHGQLKPLFDKVRNHKVCRQLLSFSFEDNQTPELKRLDLDKIAELLRLGDYYRSKEALGADLLRMLEYYRRFLSSNTHAEECINSLGIVIKEIFFDTKDSSANPSSSENQNSSSQA